MASRVNMADRRMELIRTMVILADLPDPNTVEIVTRTVETAATTVAITVDLTEFSPQVNIVRLIKTVMTHLDVEPVRYC